MEGGKEGGKRKREGERERGEWKTSKRRRVLKGRQRE